MHDVLYIHELKNVSLLFLIDGFGTTSPKFLTEIFSPSVVTLDVSDGISSVSYTHLTLPTILRV